ncbi:MAG TPA: hypothetical protein VIK82_00835 [Porticoccaceae bacterium]
MRKSLAGRQRVRHSDGSRWQDANLCKPAPCGRCLCRETVPTSRGPARIAPGEVIFNSYARLDSARESQRGNWGWDLSSPAGRRDLGCTVAASSGVNPSGLCFKMRLHLRAGQSQTVAREST